ATIAAVYPHMTQLGGDGFWLVRERSGRVRALMAAGRAGANARRELYRDYETIPPRGALAALTVPAAVGGWMVALEAANAQGGRVPPWPSPRAGDRPCARGRDPHPEPGPLHRREARRAQRRARLRANVSARRQAARGRRDAQAGSARRDARASRPRRARRFLPRRCRPRDRWRSRPRWQPGDARRSRTLPRHAR